MTALTWDQVGTRKFETGVDRGVLYLQDNDGDYVPGVAWNGLTTVTESPSGAEPTPLYADNMKYLNLLSLEEFMATIEAFTYPDEFAQCDGSAQPEVGVFIGQQNRATFGFCYRTKVGNDLNRNLGYKLHLVYGCLAAPSEKANTTVNETPEALNFSWEISTTPVEVGTIGSVDYAPTSHLVIDSTKVDADALAALELVLYGSVGIDPRMPLPAEVVGFFSGSLTLATPAVPAYNSSTDEITIPGTTGVIYKINGSTVEAGTVVITENTLVTAIPAPGYYFPTPTADEWLIVFA